MASGTGRGEQATKVTLTRRADAGGSYGTSAYSFRCASQDLKVHRNNVDLVLNNCGQLHVSAHGGQENRVAQVTGKKLADVTALPKEGWLKSCFQPEKDALYVLDVNDGEVHFPVKLRVLEASPDKVTIEWAPLPTVRAEDGEAGVLGTCAGAHDCS
jgi:hypothetical protein